tara:strand:+ start:43213 stop:43803 length:591 start_codon:yes stop_codon:yes gene_type:complete
VKVRSYRVWIVLAAAALGICLAGEPLTDLLRYDRAAIAQGELWRLLTAHLTHLSLNHAILNLAALALTAYVSDGRIPLWHQSLCWLWLFAFTGVLLYLTSPDLSYYVGLSGALHGALIVAIAFSPYYSRLVRFGTLAVISAKIVWEQSPFYDDMANADFLGGRVETRAHLYGALAGVLWVAVLMAWKHYEQRQRQH